MDALQSYLADCPTKKFPKDDTILLQGVKPDHAFVVKKGIVKMYNLTTEGEEKSILFNTNGEVFPICWLFSKTTETLYYYQAYTDCILYLVRKDIFMQALRANPCLTFQILDNQVTWYVTSTLRINALEQSRAQVKLLSVLHLLCLRYGKEVGPHKVRIEVPFTQYQLAHFTGLTRETTTIELSQLKRKKLLTVVRKYYIIDTEKLNELLDDDYNPGINIQG